MNMVLYREYDLDGKEHWLVARVATLTMHGYEFFNPETGWHESKIDARCYKLESAEAQIALLCCQI